MTLIDPCALPQELRGLEALIGQRLSAAAHGDLPKWLRALQALPALHAEHVSFDDRVTVEGAATAAERTALRDALLNLHPWRKGPFFLFGVHVDSEWRSDWKWRRLVPHLASLAGHRVLDVGSGNGYFGWRLLGAGARQVVGVDPSRLFCLQHLAVNRYVGNAANLVLPVRFEELPPAEFDTVLSMGVIYHRRDPEAHVRRLFRHTRGGGRVVLESLVVEAAEPLVPDGRYARMRNVWMVPTPARAQDWLTQAGFVDVRLADLTPTTVGEQRSTPWMRFESLATALDPANPAATVEGHPAPLRAIVIGRKPV